MKNETIKVNKEFSLESDPNNWVVNHHKDGTSKTTKKTITVTSQHYFPRIEQAFNFIIENSTKKCKNIKEMLVVLAQTKSDILKAVKKQI
jgi:hypothetical protein